MSGLRLQEQLFSVNGKPETDDPYPVAVQKDGLTVGHVLRTIFCIYSVFVRRGGSIVCTITGKRKHSCDLPQGGLELPCTYTFSGRRALGRLSAPLLQPEYLDAVWYLASPW